MINTENFKLLVEFFKTTHKHFPDIPNFSEGEYAEWLNSFKSQKREVVCKVLQNLMDTIKNPAPKKMTFDAMNCGAYKHEFTLHVIRNRPGQTDPITWQTDYEIWLDEVIKLRKDLHKSKEEFPLMITSGKTPEEVAAEVTLEHEKIAQRVKLIVNALDFYQLNYAFFMAPLANNPDFSNWISQQTPKLKKVLGGLTAILQAVAVKNDRLYNKQISDYENAVKLFEFEPRLLAEILAQEVDATFVPGFEAQKTTFLAEYIELNTVNGNLPRAAESWYRSQDQATYNRYLNSIYLDSIKKLSEEGDLTKVITRDMFTHLEKLDLTLSPTEFQKQVTRITNISFNETKHKQDTSPKAKDNYGVKHNENYSRNIKTYDAIANDPNVMLTQMAKEKMTFYRDSLASLPADVFKAELNNIVANTKTYQRIADNQRLITPKVYKNFVYFYDSNMALSPDVFNQKVKLNFNLSAEQFKPKSHYAHNIKTFSDLFSRDDLPSITDDIYTYLQDDQRLNLDPKEYQAEIDKILFPEQQDDHSSLPDAQEDIQEIIEIKSEPKIEEKLVASVEDEAPVENKVEDEAPVENKVEDEAPVENKVEDEASVENKTAQQEPINGSVAQVLSAYLKTPVDILESAAENNTYDYVQQVVLPSIRSDLNKMILKTSARDTLQRLYNNLNKLHSLKHSSGYEHTARILIVFAIKELFDQKTKFYAKRSSKLIQSLSHYAQGFSNLNAKEDNTTLKGSILTTLQACYEKDPFSERGLHLYLLMETIKNYPDVHFSDTESLKQVQKNLLDLQKSFNTGFHPTFFGRKNSVNNEIKNSIKDCLGKINAVIQSKGNDDASEQLIEERTFKKLIIQHLLPICATSFNKFLGSNSKGQTETLLKGYSKLFTFMRNIEAMNEKDLQDPVTVDHIKNQLNHLASWFREHSDVFANKTEIRSAIDSCTDRLEIMQIYQLDSLVSSTHQI